MGMNAADIGAMTLAELEAVSARFASAVATIREAQSLLGGSPVVITRPVEASGPVAPIPVANAFTASELAARKRLLSSIRGEELPADIASAEEQ